MAAIHNIFAEIARWSYFVISILSLINGFINLHIQIEMNSCPNGIIKGIYSSRYHMGSEEEIEYFTQTSFNCIGRSLSWKINDQFNFDTNGFLWRNIFSLQPEIFFDMWPPIILSLIAIVQHIDKLKFEWMSEDWNRSLLFIIFWQLFCVIGYGGNFGLIIGFMGLCGVATLYFIVSLFLLFKSDNIEINGPVLDLCEYTLMFIKLFEYMKSAYFGETKQLSTGTEPGGAGDGGCGCVLASPVETFKNKMKYNPIAQNEIDYNDDDDSVQSVHCVIIDEKTQIQYPDITLNQDNESSQSTVVLIASPSPLPLPPPPLRIQSVEPEILSEDENELVLSPIKE